MKALLFGMSLAALCLGIVAGAKAHDAPAGWSYPYACCSDQDCRPVGSDAIGEGSAGYTIRATGEVLSYADTRVRFSPDGEFHWCSVAGGSDTRTLCLFVPPRAF